MSKANSELARLWQEERRLELAAQQEAEFEADLATMRQRTRETFDFWERSFGGKIRDWRRARSWSQEDLAQKMTELGFEMHQTTVAKIERGTRPLRVAEAVALAQVFDVPALAVFHGPGPELEPLSISRMREHMESIEESLADAQERLRYQANQVAYWETDRAAWADMLNRAALREERNSNGDDAQP